MPKSLRPYNAWVAQKYRNLSPTPTTMNKRVDVWKKVAITNELGQVAYTDSLVRTVWAQIVPQTGSMTRQQMETILTDVTHKVVMYFQSAADISVGDFLMYQGRRFNIQFTLSPYEANWMMELFCQEVQDS